MKKTAKNILLAFLAFVITFFVASKVNAQCTLPGGNYRACTPEETRHYPALNDLDSLMTIYVNWSMSGGGGSGGVDVVLRKLDSAIAAAMWRGIIDTMGNIPFLSPGDTGVYLKKIMEIEEQQYNSLTNIDNATAEEPGFGSLGRFAGSDGRSVFAWEQDLNPANWHSVFKDANDQSVFTNLNGRSVFKSTSGEDVFIGDDGYSVFWGDGRISYFKNPETNLGVFVDYEGIGDFNAKDQYTGQIESVFKDANKYGVFTNQITGTSLIKDITDSLNVNNTLERDDNGNSVLKETSGDFSGYSGLIDGADGISFLRKMYEYQNVQIDVYNLMPGATLDLDGVASGANQSSVIIGGYLTTTPTIKIGLSDLTGLLEFDKAFITGTLNSNMPLGSIYEHVLARTVTAVNRITVFVAFIKR